MYCARSIQRFVEGKFGHTVGSKVMELCRTASCRHEDTLMYEIELLSNNAARFLLDMPANTWKNTDWFDKKLGLPRRYGIQTSFDHNISSHTTVQQTTNKTQSRSWMTYLEDYIGSFSNQTSKSRIRFEEEDPSKVVSKVDRTIRQYWRESEGLEIIEIRVENYTE